LPEEQALQVVEPAVDEYFPVAQLEHTADEVPAEVAANLPTLHGIQLDAPEDIVAASPICQPVE